MANFAAMKLGKQAAVADPRNLKSARYFTKELPPPPQECDWSAAISRWPMHDNDQIGICALASHAHQQQCWTANADGAERQFMAPTAELRETYFQLTGGADSGLVMLECLKHFQRQGLCGRKIGPYLDVDFRDPETLAQSIAILGSVYMGVQLPLAAQDMEVWDAPRFRRRRFGRYARGSWGGHAIAVVGYAQEGLWLPTWGEKKRMTWEFVEAYCDEAYGIVSIDWTNDVDLAPNGMDMAAMTHDLAALRAAA